jgi:hypothetical protein
MIMKINNGSYWHAIAALLFIGALAVGFLSTSTLAASASGSTVLSGGGISTSGNAGGDVVVSSASGMESNHGNQNGGGGSGGCRVTDGPVTFVPTSTTTETQSIDVGSGNGKKPPKVTMIKERTVTVGENQMTIYTTCTCENTHQTETTSTVQVLGTETRYSPWKTTIVRG